MVDAHMVRCIVLIYRFWDIGDGATWLESQISASLALGIFTVEASSLEVKTTMLTHASIRLARGLKIWIGNSTSLQPLESLETVFIQRLIESHRIYGIFSFKSTRATSSSAEHYSGGEYPNIATTKYETRIIMGYWSYVFLSLWIEMGYHNLHVLIELNRNAEICGESGWWYLA